MRKTRTRGLMAAWHLLARAVLRRVHWCLAVARAHLRATWIGTPRRRTA